MLWKVSRLQRVAYCGRFAADKGQGVTVKASGSVADGTRRAGFGGLQTCGSTWACPVCAEKIQAERQSELQTGLEAWSGAVLFGTLTLRHNKGHRLADLWDAIGPAWNRTTSGAGVAWNGGKPRKDGTRVIGDRERFGIRGYVRVVEVKHGDNGWHPHIHFLLFLDRELSSAETADLSARMFGRWESALADRGLSVIQSVGIDLRPVAGGNVLADYFAKSAYRSTGAAAYEVTGSQSKTRGKGGRTPFEILRDVVDLGDRTVEDAERDLALWREWEKASRKRRQLTWSRGMRAALGLGVERTDEEIVEEDHGGDVLEEVTSVEWRAGRLGDRRLLLLEAAEADDTGEALCALLNRLQVERRKRPNLPRRRE